MHRRSVGSVGDGEIEGVVRSRFVIQSHAAFDGDSPGGGVDVEQALSVTAGDGPALQCVTLWVGTGCRSDGSAGRGVLANGKDLAGSDYGSLIGGIESRPAVPDQAGDVNTSPVGGRDNRPGAIDAGNGVSFAVALGVCIRRLKGQFARGGIANKRQQSIRIMCRDKCRITVGAHRNPPRAFKPSD